MDRRPFLLALTSALAGCNTVDTGVLTETTDTAAPTGTPTGSPTGTDSPTGTTSETPTATDSPTVQSTPTVRGDVPATRIAGYATDSIGPISLRIELIRRRLDGDKPAFIRVEIRNDGDEPVELAFERSDPGPWLSARDDPRAALVQDPDGDDSADCWRLATRPTQKTPTASGQTLDPGIGFTYGYELWGVPPAEDDDPGGDVPPGCLTTGTYSFGRQLTVDGGSGGIELELAGS